MEQVAHMRLSGHADAFPLASAAHRQLLDYLADARAALAMDPDGDEILRDLESAIGDRLRSLLDETSAPIGDLQMAHVLSAAGTVETDHATAPSQREPRRGPFWCRISDGRWFGGICLGIAARGDFRVDWVRTIAILLLLLTGGLLGFVYLALLLALPAVPSVDEYERIRNSPRST